MQESPIKRARKVVPRWRSIDRTPSTELRSVKQKKPVEHGGGDEFDRLISEWKASENLSVAMDLLPLSVMLGNRTVSVEVSKFILESRNAPPLLRQLAFEHTREFKRDYNKESAIGLNFYRQKLALAKKDVVLYPRNAIGHVNIARLYASVGQSDKAERFFRLALSLAPHNRFVLRSAARFYVHLWQLDKALEIFNNAPKNDPWIVATQIALADLADSKQVWVKIGRNLLEADFESSQLSELAASLATLESKEGARRRANKLFRRASMAPNDNAVAQLHWAHETHLIDFDEKWLEVEHTYEARAGHAFICDDWSGVTENCRQWLLDEPFAARPAELGGYVAAELMQDYDLSRGFAEAALIANPNNIMLLNNLAYSAAALGDLVVAEEKIQKALMLEKDGDVDPVLTATRGFLHFRKNDFQNGRLFYEKAVNLAIEDKNRITAEQAIIHWMHEEVRAGMIVDEEHITIMHNRFKKHSEPSDISAKIYASLLEPQLNKARRAKLVDTEIKKRFAEVINISK